jgi:hypothetical protein
VKQTPYGILAEYPLGNSDIYHLWQRVHGRPIVNDAPAETPADQGRLMLLDPAAPGTASALSFLGITAIAMHPGAHVDTEVDPREPQGNPGYELVGRFSDGASVWQVVAPPEAAFVTFPGGLGTPRRLSDGTIGFPLDSTAGVGVLQLTAKAPGIVRLTFDAIPPSGSQRTLRLADAQNQRVFPLNGKTPISILVAVPRGQSELLLKTDPPATSDADAIEISPPRADRAGGTPSLRAVPTSRDPGLHTY